MERFQRTGNLSDILEAISVNQQAVRLIPDAHEVMPAMLNNLGTSFQCRFERTGEVDDLSEAISAQQRAVELTPEGHPAMPRRLNNLGNSFQYRFERTGDDSDLSEAVSIQQQAVQLTPDDHPAISGRLTNLGTSFQMRFGRTGDLDDLREAISHHQRAVQLTPNGHPGIPMLLNNLGLSFQARFKRTGDVSDILEAISVQQQAVRLSPDGHPDIPVWLSNLGASFQRLFERTGDISDLTEAMLNKQRAVHLTPNGHVDIPKWLNNLGLSFLRRFDLTGNICDLAEAISIQRQAVQLTPDGHPAMPLRLNNLGMGLLSRFERAGGISDLSEAISTQQRAVQLIPDGHPDVPMLLNNLGLAFKGRFEHTGEVSDILEAISIQQRAVQLTPHGHADITKWLNTLARSFLRRFKHLGDLSDIHAAASAFQKSATTSGPPSDRLSAAQQWAELSMTHALPQPLTAYGVAIDLISEIAGMDRTIGQRHKDLVDISSLTTSAALAAFTLGDAEKALEWLEQGRCLVWSQLNQLRTPIEHLHAHDKQLAQRFSDISSALEASGSRRGSEGLSIDTPLSEKISLQDEARLHTRLSRQWSELLDEIRRIPQFYNFLRPPQTSDLLKHLPLDGIVILVNVHKDRCDALALISGSDIPIHIALNDFTHKEASELRERLRRFLSSHRVRMREAGRGPRPVLEEGDDTRSEIHFVLEALWLRVVEPILDGLEFPVSVSRFTTYHFVDIFIPVSWLAKPNSNMVVSNWSPCVPSPSCCRNLWSK